MFAADDWFRDQVDDYVLANIAEVTNSKKFYGLPRVAVEIVGKSESQLAYLRQVDSSTTTLWSDLNFFPR